MKMSFDLATSLSYIYRLDLADFELLEFGVELFSI